MNEQDKNLTKFTFTTFITGLTAISFLSGVIYLSLFSYLFNFNYFDFLDLNEVFTHVLKDLAMVSVPYIFAVILGLILGENSARKDATTRTKSIIKFMNSAIFLYTYNILLLLVLIFVLTLFFNKKIITAELIQLLSIIFTSVIGPYIFKTINSVFIALQVQRNKQSALTIYLTFFVVILTIWNTTRKVIDYKKFHTSYGSYIVLSRDTVKSDSNYYYIGKTSKYYFFHNEQTNGTDVYPDNEVKKFSLRNN